MSVEDALIEKLRALPPDKQQEVLDFAEFIGKKAQALQPRRSLKGALAHLNLHVTEEDIRSARREMWPGYVREDFK